MLAGCINVWCSCRILPEEQIRQNERQLETETRQHDIVVRFVKEFTHGAEFVKQQSYKELFSLLEGRRSLEGTGVPRDFE